MSEFYYSAHHDDPRLVWKCFYGMGTPVEETSRLGALDGQTIRVFKKAYLKVSRNKPPHEYCLVELEIHRRTQRRQPVNKKCRAASAKVIAIYAINKEITSKGWARSMGKKLRRNRVAIAGHDRKFEYRVGERVKPTKKFDTDNSECRPGIHFFLTQQEALDYCL